MKENYIFVTKNEIVVKLNNRLQIFVSFFLWDLFEGNKQNYTTKLTKKKIEIEENKKQMQGNQIGNSSF